MSSYSKICVTGASGHIGNVVCRILASQGVSVRAQYNSFKKSLEEVPVEKVSCDIFDEKGLNDLMQGCDLLIHCAAMISIQGDPSGIVFRTNTEGTKNVIESARRQGVKRMIHISSVHAVEELPLHLPFDESRPYKSAEASSYDQSKAIPEQLVLESGKRGDLEIVILRPSSVLGPFDFKPSQVGRALLDFYDENIPALPPGGYDFSDVRDVAGSIVRAIEKGKNGEIYHLTGTYYPMTEFARVIHEVTGKKVPSIIIPYAVLRMVLPFISVAGKITGKDPLFTRQSIDALKYAHTNMDHSKAARELGHSCRPLSQTIRDFFDWRAGKKISI